MTESTINEVIDCDTQRIRTCGEDILMLAEEFEGIITELYDCLTGLSGGEGKWSGDDAELYMSLVLPEKDLYLAFCEELKKLGLCYQESAEKLENSIRRVRIN